MLESIKTFYIMAKNKDFVYLEKLTNYFARIKYVYKSCTTTSLEFAIMLRSTLHAN